MTKYVLIRSITERPKNDIASSQCNYHGEVDKENWGTSISSLWKGYLIASFQQCTVVPLHRTGCYMHGNFFIHTQWENWPVNWGLHERGLVFGPDFGHGAKGLDYTIGAHFKKLLSYLKLNRL